MDPINTELAKDLPEVPSVAILAEDTGGTSHKHVKKIA